MKKITFLIILFILMIPLYSARAASKVIQSTGGTPSADPIYSDYNAAKAFNEDTADYWHAGWSSGWIEYDFGEPKEVSGYELAIMDYVHAGSQNQAPKDWTFEYYDGDTWQVIDTQTDQTGWDYEDPGEPDSHIRSYDLSSPMTAQRFRLNITAANGGSISIAVLRFYDMVEGPTQTPTATATTTPTVTPTATVTPTGQPTPTRTPSPTLDLTYSPLAPPSVPVDPGTTALVYSVILANNLTVSQYYAITGITDENYFRFISFIGMTGTISSSWSLDNNVNYIGLMLLDYTGSTPTGYIQGQGTDFDTKIYNTLIPHSAKEDIIQPELATSQALIFPWQNGTKMWVGPLGTHNCGFSLSGWKAVDMVSDGNTSEGAAPDVVYASASGTISYICKGDINEAVKIGDMVYEHLRPGNYKVGDQYSQGEPLGNLVHGPFSEGCGWADQGKNNFHIHWCSPDGYWTNVEGWSYDYGAACWRKGSESVCVGQSMTAKGGGTSPGPGPDPGGGSGSGGNIWTYILNGITKVVAFVVYKLPDHNEIGITQMVVNTTSTGIAVLFIVIFTQINPTWPLILLTVWGISEGARGVYAIWRIILKAIPFLN